VNVQDQQELMALVDSFREKKGFTEKEIMLNDAGGLVLLDKLR